MSGQAGVKVLPRRRSWSTSQLDCLELPARSEPNADFSLDGRNTPLSAPCRSPSDSGLGRQESTGCGRVSERSSENSEPCLPSSSSEPMSEIVPKQPGRGRFKPKPTLSGGLWEGLGVSVHWSKTTG